MIKKICSFAKINLFLYVTGKRKDGYHNLYSLMTQIDLCDDIYIDFSTKKMSVACNHPDVPEDESNLAYKAAILFFRSMESMGKAHGGISIRIKKAIPPGGGLGGGSSNAAAVLTALNTYYNSPFSKPDLMRLGLKLGADVPFFIFGCPAIARGVGEKLEKAPDLKPYHLVLCDPGVAAATAQVYKNIDFRLTANQKYNINTGLNVPLQGQEFDIRDQMHNDLEESACRLYPRIKETKETLSVLFQRKVYMTGSGACLFALFSDRKNAEKGYERLLNLWKNTRRKIFLSSFRKKMCV